MGREAARQKGKEREDDRGIFSTSTMNHEGITLVGKEIGVLPLRFRTQYFARY